MKAHIHKAAGRRLAQAVDGRVLLAEMDHIPEELVDILVLLKQPPVKPRDLIILAIRIVVAKLGIAKFVSRKEHRRPSACKERRAGILDHPLS